MSFMSRVGPGIYALTHAFKQTRPPLRSLERRVNDFSKTIIGKDVNKRKPLPFEEFKKKVYPISLESYKRRTKAEFPGISDEVLEEQHETACRSAYRTYKRACTTSNDIGLMLTSDFFDDPKD